MPQNLADKIGEIGKETEERKTASTGSRKAAKVDHGMTDSDEFEGDEDTSRGKLGEVGVKRERKSNALFASRRRRSI